MLANSDIANLRYDRVTSSWGSNMINLYSNSATGRSVGRIMALSIGAPVEMVALAEGLSVHTFAALMYLFENEMLGMNGAPGVWGQEYSDAYAQRGIHRAFVTSIDITDVLCFAYNGVRQGDSAILLNKIATMEGVDVRRFADYYIYQIANRGVNVSSFLNFLNICESGAILKAVMDAINGRKSESRFRDLLVNARAHNSFENVAALVTQRIAGHLQN